MIEVIPEAHSRSMVYKGENHKGTHSGEHEECRQGVHGDLPFESQRILRREGEKPQERSSPEGQQQQERIRAMDVHEMEVRRHNEANGVDNVATDHDGQNEGQHCQQHVEQHRPHFLHQMVLRCIFQPLLHELKCRHYTSQYVLIFLNTTDPRAFT